MPELLAYLVSKSASRGELELAPCWLLVDTSPLSPPRCSSDPGAVKGTSGARLTQVAQRLGQASQGGVRFAFESRELALTSVGQMI